VVYTYGIVEATNPEGQIFGAQRLSQLPALRQAMPAMKLIESIIRACQAFTRLESFQDDVAIVVVRRKMETSQST